jgi:hypothetical protein
MKAVNDIWRQLVGRRLLPVAMILAAALVAVPFALGKGSTDAPKPKLLPVDETAAAKTKTLVSLAAPAPTTKRRKVLGTKANPFMGEKLPKVKEHKPATTASTGGGTSNTSTESPDSVYSAPTSSGGSAPATSVPTPNTAPVDEPAPKTYAPQELTIRFGESEDSVERRSLKRLQALPGAQDPTLIYLGVLKDGKTAVFLVDKGVSAVGDGSCVPTPEKCETVRLKAGETEFFDVVDESGSVTAQYQLDLVKIHNANSGSAARASASGDRASGSRNARSVRRARWSAAYRGTLQATVASETVALP